MVEIVDNTVTIAITRVVMMMWMMVVLGRRGRRGRRRRRVVERSRREYVRRGRGGETSQVDAELIQALAIKSIDELTLLVAQTTETSARVRVELVTLALDLVLELGKSLHAFAFERLALASETLRLCLLALRVQL